MDFRFADFVIDVERYELLQAGERVPIEPQVFDLLVYLVQNRNRVVSKDELLDVIWKGRTVAEATMSSRVSSARRAIGDNGFDQLQIRTYHKRGFRFVGSVNNVSPSSTQRQTVAVAHSFAKPLSVRQQALSLIIS